jgi:glucokinase
MAECFLGIEIGGSKLQLVAGVPGQIHERCRFHVDAERGAEGIREQIEQVLPKLIERWKPGAIAVGFGGPVDRRTGCISRSHQIEGWSGFNLQGWLSKISASRVLVDNDANTGALGEAIVGAGKNLDPVFYVTLGSGVGGGLVVAGRIYHGAPPGESEIGHVRLDPSGTLVEDRCSGWAVDRKIRARAKPGTVLYNLIGAKPGGEARHLARAVELRDPTAQEILTDTAADLAFALSHVVHLFHPAVIVLGGGLALTGEPLRDAVARALPPLLMEVFQPGPAVRLAALAEDAVPMGCLVAADQAAR